MRQIAEEAAAEWVIPHVLHNAAAIGIGVGLLQFFGRRHGKSLQKHFPDGVVPHRVNDGFVGEHRIAIEDRVANQQQRNQPSGAAHPGPGPGMQAAVHSTDRRPKQLNDEHNHRKDQQKVNKSAKRIRRDQSEQPQYQENYKYCPKHRFSAPSFHAASKHADGH